MDFRLPERSTSPHPWRGTDPDPGTPSPPADCEKPRHGIPRDEMIGARIDGSGHTYGDDSANRRDGDATIRSDNPAVVLDQAYAVRMPEPFRGTPTSAEMDTHSSTTSTSQVRCRAGSFG